MLTNDNYAVFSLENTVMVCIDLPGVEPSHMEINFYGPVLHVVWIRANPIWDTYGSNEKRKLLENSIQIAGTDSRYGRHELEMMLPICGTISRENVRVTFVNGVLTVTIDKSCGKEHNFTVNFCTQRPDTSSVPEITTAVAPNPDQ
jgi:HSP20 family molecular chaperone IbpA